MAAQNHELSNKIKSGQLNIATAEGKAAIQEIARENPRDLVHILGAAGVNAQQLEETLRNAGVKQSVIDAVVADQDGLEPKNPFGSTELKPNEPDPEDDSSPFFYDPSSDISRGPKFRGR